MHEDFGAQPVVGAEPAALAPVEDYLTELHDRVSALTGGKPADYIPELGKVEPSLFGIAIATTDGEVYGVGDTQHPFTIQSVSKPFMYGYALNRYGREAVLKHVGVEPTGEAFNSIVLDEVANRPFNPMVNAGAIAVAELMDGASQEQRTANMLALFGDLAGRPLGIDEVVFRSEEATGHRNRAIAYMMLNTGMIKRDSNDVLDLYFRQCSVNVTTRDLAIMAATLANDGTNPITGKKVFQAEYVRDVLSVMNSCGMYDYAGEWAYEVGMPAKSGVSGCIIAVIPGQIGIGVFAPPIDSHGNSLRGIRVCQEISKEFELHAFNNRTNVRSVIRREYRGDLVHSNRLRTPYERQVLARQGDKVAVLEAQGALFFGSTEQLLRRIAQLAAETRYVVVDFKRVHLADASAHKLIARAARSIADSGAELVFASIADDGPLGTLARELGAQEERRAVVHLQRHRRRARMVRGPVVGRFVEGIRDEICALRARPAQRAERRGLSADRTHRQALGLREGRGHHPRGSGSQAVLRGGARHSQRADQSPRTKWPQEAGCIDRPGLELWGNGVARRRQTLGRHRSRREGDLLRTRRRSARGTRG